MKVRKKNLLGFILVLIYLSLSMSLYTSIRDFNFEVNRFNSSIKADKCFKDSEGSKICYNSYKYLNVVDTGFPLIIGVKNKSARKTKLDYILDSISHYVENNFTGLKIYQIEGKSMNPTIKNNSVFLCDKNYRKLEKGDIIVYNESKVNYVIAHRIKKVLEENKFKTRGDYNNWTDPYIVNQSEIICRYVF